MGRKDQPAWRGLQPDVRPAPGGEFDLVFYSVQAAELAIGAVQLTLMGANLRDGFRLAGRSMHALDRQPAT